MLSILLYDAVFFNVVVSMLFFNVVVSMLFFDGFF